MRCFSFDKKKEVIDMNELEKLASPLIEYLKQDHNPHTYIVITDEVVQVLRVEASIPTPKEND